MLDNTKTEELENLKKLYDKGVLTKEEYEARKEQLLSEAIGQEPRPEASREAAPKPAPEASPRAEEPKEGPTPPPPAGNPAEPVPGNSLKASVTFKRIGMLFLVLLILFILAFTLSKRRRHIMETSDATPTEVVQDAAPNPLYPVFQGKGRPKEERTSTTTEGVPAEEYTSVESVIYDAKGRPVERRIEVRNGFNDPWTDTKYIYDEDGFLSTIKESSSVGAVILSTEKVFSKSGDDILMTATSYSQPIAGGDGEGKEVLSKMTTRITDNGKVRKEIDEDGKLLRTITFDQGGRIVEDRVESEDGAVTVKSTYDKGGNLTRQEFSSADGSPARVVDYEITKRDSKGNWAERKSTENGVTTISKREVAY